MEEIEAVDWGQIYDESGNYKFANLSISVDDLVKGVHGENYNGVFEFLDNKFIYIKGKGFTQKDLVKKRLEGF
jgi:hypothetical protein